MRRRVQEKPPVYRTPEELSDQVYQTFYELVHRAKLIEGTVIFAQRMIREEAFDRRELLAIRAILTDEAPEAEVSAEILGGSATLDWINSILAGRIQANA
jgi:hypothetical protein